MATTSQRAGVGSIYTMGAKNERYADVAKGTQPLAFDSTIDKVSQTKPWLSTESAAVLSLVGSTRLVLL